MATLTTKKTTKKATKKKTAKKTAKKTGKKTAKKKTASSSRSGKSLVIVESPAKANTISKYLGSGFVVKASVGHIMDLPKSKLGIDVDQGFKPTYELIKGKEKVVRELKAAARSASRIYLAADHDREGEAISWHLPEGP